MIPRQDTFRVIAAYGFDRLRERISERLAVNHATGCWEFSGTLVSGYGRIRVGTHDRVVTHRAAWIIANRRDPGELLVCHTCDNRRCCNPDHLWLGSALDNVRDMDAKGRCRRICYGRKSRKLSTNDAAAIRESTDPVPLVAARHGISESHAYNIRRGECWTAESAAKRRDARAASDLLKSSRFHDERK